MTEQETKLLSRIAEKCASITINKWLVQVIDNNGTWYTAYFAQPPGNHHPESDVKIAFANDKTGALAAVLEAMK